MISEIYGFMYCLYVLYLICMHSHIVTNILHNITDDVLNCHKNTIISIFAYFIYKVIHVSKSWRTKKTSAIIESNETLKWFKIYMFFNFKMQERLVVVTTVSVQKIWDEASIRFQKTQALPQHFLLVVAVKINVSVLGVRHVNVALVEIFL